MSDNYVKHKVHCLEAHYDEDSGFLAINCNVLTMNSDRRIFVMHRQDFHYKHPGNEVPHNEMHRTADLMRNKKFFIEVHDDPEKENISEDDQLRVASVFNRQITDKLSDITDMLSSDDRIAQRKAENILGRARAQRVKSMGLLE